MRSTPDRTSRAWDGRRASARRETYSSPAPLKPWALGLRGRYRACSFGFAPLGRSVQSVLRGASHALDRVAGNTRRDYAIGHSISHSPTASGRNEQTAAVCFSSLRGPAAHAVPFFGRGFRPSFSSIAAVTNSMTDVSCVTQCSFRRRWRSFGMRVANCVSGSSVLSRAMASGAQLHRTTRLPKDEDCRLVISGTGCAWVLRAR